MRTGKFDKDYLDELRKSDFHSLSGHMRWTIQWFSCEAPKL